MGHNKHHLDSYITISWGVLSTVDYFMIRNIRNNGLSLKKKRKMKKKI